MKLPEGQAADPGPEHAPGDESGSGPGGLPSGGVTVDARGVLCPVPIIRLARAASARPAGTVVELLTDDPAAAHDVPAWCRLRGHTLLATTALATPPDGPVPGLDRPAALGLDGPEPHAPNLEPGQALRHLIRLAGPPSTVSAPG